MNRRSLSPSFPPTHNLKYCDTYEELVGSKAIPSKPFIYSGWCIFIKDCRYSSDLTPQNTSELQKILSARHISHNSPCLHVKRQDGEHPAHWTRRLSRMHMVGSSEVALNLRRFTSLYPSLYLIVFRLWLHHLSLSSGLISYLHFRPPLVLWVTHYGRVILNCACVVDGVPRV